MSVVKYPNEICDFCGLDENRGHCLSALSRDGQHKWVPKTVLPADQGKRTVRRSRHDLIPLEFLDEIASIFEEGLLKYGDSWKKGGRDFLIDCLNHASNHLHKYCNGDISENQLAKVAWNCLVVRYFDSKGEGLNGNTRTIQEHGKGSTANPDVERDVQSSSPSKSTLVERSGERPSTKTERPRDVVFDPQRDF